MAITPLTAGDLITAAKLNEVITAVSEVGGATGFRNKIINGGFDIWQRGTSQTTSGYGSADRWSAEIQSSTQIVSQQTFSNGQTAVAGNPKYYHRTVVSSVAGAASSAKLVQAVESVSTFATRTCTLSFYAKADSNKNIGIEFTQYFGPTGSPYVTGLGAQLIALTTSWAKYTVTVTLPSIAGKTIVDKDFLGVIFWFDAGSNYNSRSSNLGQQSGTFDIAQVQLEAGTQASQMEYRPYNLELSMCQRYYEAGGFNWTMYQATGNGFTVYTPFKVTKRASPDMTTSGVGLLNVSNPSLGADVNGFNSAAWATVTGTVVYAGAYQANSEI